MNNDDMLRPNKVERYACAICGDDFKSEEAALECAREDTRSIVVTKVHRRGTISGYPTVFEAVFRTDFSEMYARVTKCPDCDGTGEVPAVTNDSETKMSEVCRRCKGEKYVVVTRE